MTLRPVRPTAPTVGPKYQVMSDLENAEIGKRIEAMESRLCELKAVRLQKTLQHVFSRSPQDRDWPAPEVEEMCDFLGPQGVLDLWHSGASDAETPLVKDGSKEPPCAFDDSLANDVLSSWFLGIAEVGTGSSSSSCAPAQNDRQGPAKPLKSRAARDARGQKASSQMDLNSASGRRDFTSPLNVANLFSASDLQPEKSSPTKQVQEMANGDESEKQVVPLEDWARIETACANLQVCQLEDLAHTLQPRPGGLPSRPHSLESDPSLGDLLRPLVSEAFTDLHRITMPTPLDVPLVLVALAVSGEPDDVTHFERACQSLATAGFRICSVVMDKLGLSVRCLKPLKEYNPDGEEYELPECFHFPWASVMDIEPKMSADPDGEHLIVIRVREPVALGNEPSGGLMLVLRMADRALASRIVDCTLAFKSYEFQMVLFNSRVSMPSSAAAHNGAAALFLDEKGFAFWRLGWDQLEQMEEQATLAASHNVDEVQSSSVCNNFLFWC